jgi:hypothetical protein
MASAGAGTLAAPRSSGKPFFQAEAYVAEPDVDAGRFNPLCADGIRLPPELLSVYEHATHDVQLASGVVMLSLDEVRQRDAEARAAGQQRVVAFAFSYAGMGHIRLFSWDPQDCLVGTTHDGGSNDHDRLRAATERLALDPSSLDGRESASAWMRWACAPASSVDA